jgi:putative membrane protein
MAPIYFSRIVRESPFHGGTRRIVMRVLITGIAVFLAIATVPGIESDSLSTGIAAVLVLTLLNLVLRPVLFVLTLPLIVFTLGLFLVVLNALLLELTAYLVKGFTVTGFWPAVGGALIISLVTTILNSWMIDRPIDQVDVDRRPPKIINPE